MSNDKGIVSNLKTGILLGMLVGAIAIGCAWVLSPSPQETQNGVALGEHLEQTNASRKSLTDFFVVGGAGGVIVLLLLGARYLFLKRRKTAPYQREKRASQQNSSGVSLEYVPKPSASTRAEQAEAREQSKATEPVSDSVSKPVVDSVADQSSTSSKQMPSQARQREDLELQEQEQRAVPSAQLESEEAVFLRAAKALYIYASSAWGQKKMDGMARSSTDAGLLALRTELRRPWRSRCTSIQEMTVKIASREKERVTVSFEGIVREQVRGGLSCSIQEEWDFVRHENMWKIDAIKVVQAECS